MSFFYYTIFTYQYNIISYKEQRRRYRSLRFFRKKNLVSIFKNLRFKNIKTIMSYFTTFQYILICLPIYSNMFTCLLYYSNSELQMISVSILITIYLRNQPRINIHKEFSSLSNEFCLEF